MGDRANVFFPEYQSEPKDMKGVFLYSHWGGHNLPLKVQEVLKRKQRWDDSPYLARMVFNKMTEGNETGETGYGISSQMQDNEHLITVVDCSQGRVGFASEGGTPSRWIPFSEFIEMNPGAIMELYGE